ncbi:undecaprenyl-diphosphatase UppP [Patescibacteria group bacterium]
MEYIQAIVLGIVQGLTEFIPISSSAHLVVVRELFGWDNPGVFFDAILHLGTALAVIFAFWRTWWELILSVGDMFRTRKIFDTFEKKMVWFLIIGTIPALLIGYFLEDFFEQFFTSLFWVGIFLIITGVIFHLVEFVRRNNMNKTLKKMKWWQAGLIGLVQALALFPGVSRSGITMMTGMSLGFKRSSAARFSFMLSLPVILLAGSYGIYEFATETVSGTSEFGIISVIIGFIVSAVIGFLAINAFIRFVKRNSLTVFASYMLLLGVILLVVNFI